MAIPATAAGAAFGLWRLRPKTLPVLILTAVMTAVLVLANLLIATDYKDSDGFIDCWPSCSGTQTAVGYGFWLSGGVLLVLTLGTVVALFVASRRSKRSGGPRIRG